MRKGGKEVSLISLSIVTQSSYSLVDPIIIANGTELTLDDLLGEGEAEATTSILDPKEKRVAMKVAPLAAPVPSRVQDRMDREAGYEKSKEEVTRWDPLVQKNRQVGRDFVGEEKKKRQGRGQCGH